MDIEARNFVALVNGIVKRRLEGDASITNDLLCSSLFSGSSLSTEGMLAAT